MTTHHPSPSLSLRQGPNCPLLDSYRDRVVSYRPAQLITAVVKQEIILEAKWDKGRSNEVGCNPVRAEIKIPIQRGVGPEGAAVLVEYDRAHAEVVRTDPLSGDEQPIQLHPDMAQGLIESLSEHFHPVNKPTHRSLRSSFRSEIELDDREFGMAIASIVEPFIDTRIAPSGQLASVVSVEPPMTSRAFVLA